MATILSSSTYEQELLHIVQQLSSEGILQILQFARLVQAQTLANRSASQEQEPMEETAADILADEARWDAQFAATQNGLKQMAATVRAEVQAGRTLPMIFTPTGTIAPA